MTDRLRRASVNKYEMENIMGWVSDKMADRYGDSEALERYHKCFQMMHEHESR